MITNPSFFSASCSLEQSFFRRPLALKSCMNTILWACTCTQVYPQPSTEPRFRKHHLNANNVRTGETKGAQKGKGHGSHFCMMQLSCWGSLGSLRRSERAELPRFHLCWFQGETLCCLHRLCFLLVHSPVTHLHGYPCKILASLEYLVSNLAIKTIQSKKVLFYRTL